MIVKYCTCHFAFFYFIKSLGQSIYTYKEDVIDNCTSGSFDRLKSSCLLYTSKHPGNLHSCFFQTFLYSLQTLSHSKLTLISTENPNPCLSGFDYRICQTFSEFYMICHYRSIKCICFYSRFHQYYRVCSYSLQMCIRDSVYTAEYK